MEDLDDELRDLSPLLRDLKRQGDGLRTPEGYFDDLEAQVFGRLDALGDRRPQLFPHQPAHQPHNLLGKMIARRAWPNTNQIIVYQTARRWRRSLAALAAGLALVAAAAWFFRAIPVAQPSASLAQATMPDLSEDDIENYVLENVHEFDAEQLAALPSVESDDAASETIPATPNSSPQRSKRQQALDDLQPEDLDKLLEELSDEELEKLL